jgi:hypothetical protein
LSRVSPTIGLGRIGWGCGWGAGLSAIDNILGLVDQDDDPRDHFGHEQHGADAECAGEPAKLLPIETRAVAHVERQVAVNARQVERLSIGRFHVRLMNWAGDRLNSQSRRGHRITSTAMLRATKQATAIQLIVWSSWRSACPPKNEVVIAAPAIS